MRLSHDHAFPRCTVALAVLLCLALPSAGMSGALAQDPATAASSGDPSFNITREVVAGGGVTRARSACFDLAATIAEPVAGAAAGGAYSLTAGFLSHPVSVDSIFRTGFEDCQP